MKLLTELDSLDNVKDGETRKLITKTSTSGSGNVVSSVGVSGDTITYTKGVTALTAHQKAYSTMKIGNTDVAATQAGDTFNIVAGSNVTLTPDTTNKKVTIAATDTTYESKAAASGGTAVSLVTTGEKYTWNNKQNALSTQTAYSAKGTATKVPQITTNTLGQVTKIEEVTITQPTVNNGTLTIQKNGTNVTTFGANQSTDATANITVPTKTSELTNDSNYITNTGSTSGNAGTATKLQTARKINTVNFDGSTDITVPYLGRVDTRDKMYPSDLKTAYITTGFSSKGGIDNGTNDGVFVDFIGFNSWDNNTGGRENLLFMPKTGNAAIYHYVGDYGANSWSVKKQLAYTDSSITGNAASADKLKTARTIGIGTGAIGTATSFDGSGNITIPITEMREAYNVWGGKNISGNITPDDMGCVDEFGHNKLAFLDPACLEIKYSTDGGTTWIDSGLTDAQKIAMMTTSGSTTYIGGATAATADNIANLKLRIRLACGTVGGSLKIYTAAKKLLFNVNTQGAASYVDMRYRTIANYMSDTDSWTNVTSHYTLSGGSGWNSIPFNYTFGGSMTTQTGQIGQFEFVFGCSSLGTWGGKKLGIIDIRLIGSTNWTMPSELARAGYLYKMDTNQNAAFPGDITPQANNSKNLGSSSYKWANIYATTFNGNLTGTATKATGDKNGNDITTTYYLASNPNGYTSNTGTITKVQANGTDVASSGTANIPAASTSVYGVTKLSNATDSSSEVLAATPKAVKAAYDLAASKGTGTITGVSVNGTSVATSGVANITSMPASILSGAIPSAVTATTQAATDNSTKIATTAFVKTAIDNLPEPMVFKGSLGTGGTITSLPTASSSNEGWTYKVITAGTYASQSAKVGDTFISDGSAWVLIPSGDEPSGTVTSITIKGSSPITVDSESAITTSGTRTISHANSGVTAGTYKSVTVNATGHVTSGTNPTTLSGYGITDAKIASGVITLGSNTITPLTASSTLDATKVSGTLPTSTYTDTKNTAGSTDSSSKLFLVGATSQAANPQTYSQDTAYVGTDGHLYSNSKQVVNLSDTQALTNKTYNGYTLAAACAKAVVTSIDTSASLPTSNAVKTFVEGKGYVTTDTKNTAGSTDTSSKIFLIGATSQAANPQTYSDNEVYATSGVLTTKSVQVGGTAATMQYNSTDKCIEFVFA